MVRLAHDQTGFAYRVEWGVEGVHALATECSVIVVVDVLRFSTAVNVAVEQGAIIYPYRWNDPTAERYAVDHGATLAGRREDSGWSLSPTDLGRIDRGTALVLPSPNGATIACEAVELGVTYVLAGCLRNATAVAERAWVLADGGPIGIVPAGERWDDGGLRPSVEDLLGAGAILAALDPSGSVSAPRCSPEADAARSAFLNARPRLHEALSTCSSGRELLRRGWGDDVEISAQLDASRAVPYLSEGAFAAI